MLSTAAFWKPPLPSETPSAIEAQAHAEKKKRKRKKNTIESIVDMKHPLAEVRFDFFVPVGWILSVEESTGPISLELLPLIT